MMKRKIGLLGEDRDDENLIGDLLKWMQHHEADYTNTFRDLISEVIPEGEIYLAEDFQGWWQSWQKRLKQNGKPLKSSFCLMRVNNPVLIPRNHRVEEVISAAENGSNFTILNNMLEAISEPYKEKNEYLEFRNPPKPEERVLQTFCGT